MTPPLHIPVISLSRFVHSSDDERVDIAQTFDTAFRTVGFCLISDVDEWLPPTLIHHVRFAATNFFESSLEKEKAYIDGVTGYLPRGAENVASSSGTPSATPDAVESLNLAGYQEPGREWCARADGTSDCPWESAEWLPADFAGALAAYWRGASSIMLLLMSLSEIALELPPGYFAQSFTWPGALLRLAWYPPQQADDKAREATTRDLDVHSHQLRYGEHTDFDGFTILQREGDFMDGIQGGLEVQAPNGEWTAIDAPPGTLTINIGDLLQRWTNDRWKATKHRVTQPLTTRFPGRLSVVFFTGPHPDTSIECLPSPKCASPTSPPQYGPIKAYDHVLLKMRKATGLL